MAIIVGVLILMRVGSLALGRFVPKGDAGCWLVVVVVLNVLGDVLKVFHPIDRMRWWWSRRVDPHGDEAVGWALLVVIDD